MNKVKVNKNSSEEVNNLGRWVCIYPAYINKRKTLQEGRRIPKDKAVDNPTTSEIRDVLAAAGFTVLVENKQYCRERTKDYLCKGRVRVKLTDGDAETREAVMKRAAALIPKLKTRVGKSRMSEQPPPAQPVVGAKKKGKNRK